MSTTGKVTRGHMLFRTWAAGLDMAWGGGPSRKALQEIQVLINRAGTRVRGFRRLRTYKGMYFWQHTSRCPVTPCRANREALEKASYGEIPAESWTKVIRVFERPDLPGWKPPEIF